MKNFSYLFEYKEYDRGQIIFKHGDGTGTLYFIDEGQVELFKKPKEKEMTLAEYYAKLNTDD